jgi:hypothetical protein
MQLTAAEPLFWTCHRQTGNNSEVPAKSGFEQVQVVRVIAEGAKLPQISFPETSLGCVMVFYSLRIVAAAVLHVSVRASFSDAMKRMTQAA